VCHGNQPKRDSLTEAEDTSARKQGETQTQGQFQVGGGVGGEAMAAGKGPSVMPDGTQVGLIDGSQQGFEQSKEGADRG
jgi:hypothetical protein